MLRPCRRRIAEGGVFTRVGGLDRRRPGRASDIRRHEAFWGRVSRFCAWRGALERALTGAAARFCACFWSRGPFAPKTGFRRPAKRPSAYRPSERAWGPPAPGLSAGLRCVLSAPERPAPHGFLRERPAAPSAASVVFAQPATGAGGGAARHLLAEPGSLASGSRQGVRPADAGRRPSPARRPSTLLRAPRAKSRGGKPRLPGRVGRKRSFVSCADFGPHGAVSHLTPATGVSQRAAPDPAAPRDALSLRRAASAACPQPWSYWVGPTGASAQLVH